MFKNMKLTHLVLGVCLMMFSHLGRAEIQSVNVESLLPCLKVALNHPSDNLELSISFSRVDEPRIDFIFKSNTNSLAATYAAYISRGRAYIGRSGREEFSQGTGNYLISFTEGAVTVDMVLDRYTLVACAIDQEGKASAYNIDERSLKELIKILEKEPNIQRLPLTPIAEKIRNQAYAEYLKK